MLIGSGADWFWRRTLALTSDGGKPKHDSKRHADDKIWSHSFPATVWQSVFATDLALSSSNP